MACLSPQTRGAAKVVSNRMRGESGYNCLSRRAGVGKPKDITTTVRGVSEAYCGTRTLTIVSEQSGSGSVEQEQSMAPVGFFDVLVLASGKPWMFQVRSRLHPPMLQHPPHHKEQQRMLHNGKSHIGI